jgi:peptide/nickel transport system substrate-binding protein
VAALEAEDVDAINAVPIDALERLNSSATVEVASIPSQRTVGLVMRTGRSPLDDIRVREAVAHAIDREAINDALFAGTAQVANSPFAPIIFGAHPSLEQWEYDPELSRQLLGEAGYPDGLHLDFGFTVGSDLMDKQVGEALVGMFQEVGIDVTGYEVLEWESFFPTAVNEAKFDLYTYSLGAMDPSFLIFFQALDLYHDWKPAEVDGLLADINAGPEDAAAAPLQELQEMMWQELPWVFLYYQPQIIGYSSRVEGFVPRTDEYLIFSQASLSEQ